MGYLSGLAVLDGRNATLTVSAAGSAPQGYQWFLAGRLVQVTRSPFLTVTDAQAGDEGIYHAVVANEFGRAASAGVLLTGMAPPVITSPPLDQVVAVGQAANFNAVASGGRVLP